MELCLFFHITQDTLDGFTHPMSENAQGWDDFLLSDALEDPGCPVQAAHAWGQGGDVEAQQKQEAHQGDLGKKQTERGRECSGLHPTQFRSALCGKKKKKKVILCWK